MKKDFFFHLQSLRGLAATIVVLHHLKSLSPYLSQNIFMRNSELAVDFFFVLSGFVISLNYGSTLYNLNTFIDFIKKRFFRLYPLHIFMLFIYLAVEISKYLFELKTGIASNEEPFTVNNISTFISNIFLLQGLIDNQLSYNEVSWSISFEFYTYIIFAFLVIFIRNKFLSILIIILLVIISFYFVYKLELMKSTNQLGFLRCVYSFFLGTLFLKINQKIERKNLTKFQIPISIITLYLFCNVTNTIIMPILFGFLIIVLNQSKEGVIKSFLENKLFIFIGKISYSIYMIHYLIIWTHVQILRFIFQIDTITINNYTYIELTKSLSFLIIISVLISVFFLSILSFNLIEKRFNSKRLAKHELKK